MRYTITYMPKIYGQKIKFKQKTLSMNNVNVNKQLARSLRTELHLHLPRVLVFETIRRWKTSLAEDLASQINAIKFQNLNYVNSNFHDVIPPLQEPWYKTSFGSTTREHHSVYLQSFTSVPVSGTTPE